MSTAAIVRMLMVVERPGPDDIESLGGVGSSHWQHVKLCVMAATRSAVKGWPLELSSVTKVRDHHITLWTWLYLNETGMPRYTKSIFVYWAADKAHL